jgi:preprotein translocase subunit SecF
MDRDEFFAELDGLTEKEIEGRLSSWDRGQLVLVQEYIDKKVERAKAAQAAQPERANEDAVRVSVEVSRRAHSMALMALIVALGAMMAAIASTFVAFLALRGWTISG